jgi:hypothetical protein
MAPGINKARQLLSTNIYNEHLKKPEIAMDHKAKISELH